MKRIVQFAQSNQLNIRLAYYPPYHSKYNPIGEIQIIKCPAVSMIFFAKPKYCGAFALRAKATAGHFITCKCLERVWGILENSWNGSILDEVETALNFAKNMTWKGKHPVVKLVTQTDETGVKLTKDAMSAVEKQIERLTNSKHEKSPNLGKWFVDICCVST